MYEKEKSDGGKLEFYVTETTWSNERTGEAGRHDEVHARDQLQARRRRAQAALVAAIVSYRPRSSPTAPRSTTSIVRYGWAIDTKDWALLDTCFTDDAHVDYSSNPGGKVGPYREVRGWLEKMMSAFPVTQHLMSNIDVHARRRPRDRAARW